MHHISQSPMPSRFSQNIHRWSLATEPLYGSSLLTHCPDPFRSSTTGFCLDAGTHPQGSWRYEASTDMVLACLACPTPWVGFPEPELNTTEWRHVPIIPAWGYRQEEDQGFKVILSCLEILRPAWVVKIATLMGVGGNQPQGTRLLPAFPSTD